jgi:hypothetical protein
MIEFLYQYAYPVTLIILAIVILAIFILVALQSSNDNRDEQPIETITYNQNGYYSDKSGYQTGKYAKNNRYNGR